MPTGGREWPPVVSKYSSACFFFFFFPSLALLFLPGAGVYCSCSALFNNVSSVTLSAAVYGS